MTIAEFRQHKLVVQFLEYMVGGGLYFCTGYGIFAICYSGFGWPWWVGKIAGDVVGWTLNYAVQRYWAFNSKSLYKHEFKNGVRYAVFSVFNILLDYLIIGGLNKLGITPYIGMLVAAVFFTGWNYLGYRFWVFKKAYNRSNHEHSSSSHQKTA